MNQNIIYVLIEDIRAKRRLQPKMERGELFVSLN